MSQALLVPCARTLQGGMGGEGAVAAGTPGGGEGALLETPGAGGTVEIWASGAAGDVGIHWVWGAWGHPKTQKDTEGWGDLGDMQGCWDPLDMGTLGTP